MTELAIVQTQDWTEVIPDRAFVFVLACSTLLFSFLFCFIVKCNKKKILILYCTAEKVMMVNFLKPRKTTTKVKK